MRLFTCPSTLTLSIRPSHRLRALQRLAAGREFGSNSRLYDALLTQCLSTREMRTIIRGLEGINLVACDIVEVAPAYDTNAELTTMAAADTLYEVMTLMVKKGPLSEMVNKTIDYETVLQTKPKKEL
jgi:hypothetical protein